MILTKPGCPGSSGFWFVLQRSPTENGTRIQYGSYPDSRKSIKVQTLDSVSREELRVVEAYLQVKLTNTLGD